MSDQKANTGSENFVGWMMMLVVFVLLFMLFWHYNEFKVKSVLRWMHYGEMWIVSWFVSDQYTVEYHGNQLNFKQWYDVIPKYQPQELDNNLMGKISALALTPLRVPFVILLGLMGLWAGMYGPGTNHRRKFNLDGLIGAQAANFPAIAPFVKFNPSTQPPRPPGSPVPAELPAFAEALAPEEWLAYNEIPVPDGNIDRSGAYVAFAKQLGPRWQGWEQLPPYKQVFLALCCLKAARKRKEADDMAGRLANCWSFEKGLQLSKDRKILRDARSILKNKDMSGKTLKKVNNHAFQTTALLRALQTAREEGGVLAPAQFVWMRAFDRTLWYPLNNLGRQAFHMEAFGAMAHYKAEKLTERPIPRPKVERAVDSLIEYMKGDYARPIPQLDYSRSKKRGVKKPAGKPAGKAVGKARTA